MFVRLPRVRHISFLVYSLNLLHRVTHIFWTLTCFFTASVYSDFVLSFCSLSHNFVPHFLHPNITVDALCFTNGSLICTPIADFHCLDIYLPSTQKRAQEMSYFHFLGFLHVERAFTKAFGFCGDTSLVFIDLPNLLLPYSLLLYFSRF